MGETPTARSAVVAGPSSVHSEALTRLPSPSNIRCTLSLFSNVNFLAIGEHDGVALIPVSGVVGRLELGDDPAAVAIEHALLGERAVGAVAVDVGTPAFLLAVVDDCLAARDRGSAAARFSSIVRRRCAPTAPAAGSGRSRGAGPGCCRSSARRAIIQGQASMSSSQNECTRAPDWRSGGGCRGLNAFVGREPRRRRSRDERLAKVSPRRNRGFSLRSWLRT